SALWRRPVLPNEEEGSAEDEGSRQTRPLCIWKDCRPGAVLVDERFNGAQRLLPLKRDPSPGLTRKTSAHGPSYPQGGGILRPAPQKRWGGPTDNPMPVVWHLAQESADAVTHIVLNIGAITKAPDCEAIVTVCRRRIRRARQPAHFSIVLDYLLRRPKTCDSDHELGDGE